jgi:hypothetical protein
MTTYGLVRAALASQNSSIDNSSSERWPNLK